MKHKIVIIEDEPPASKRLAHMITSLDSDMEVIEILDSVESSIDFFSTDVEYDLLFMDIQLGDGISFEIFSRCTIDKPVIFTTAYDEYTLQAFKVNSIDYILKPIDKDDLSLALDQYKIYNSQQLAIKTYAIDDLLTSLHQKKYKERFLIKKGKTQSVIYSDEVAFFHAEDGYTHLCTFDKKKYIIDHTLDQLESMMHPNTFQRVNRKMIIHVKSIDTVHDYFNSRLKLKTIPSASFDIIVARDRVKHFKLWLDTGS